MNSSAAARDMHTQAQGNKRNRMKLRVVEGKTQLKRKSIGEAAMKLPGMNGFGVERPLGLRQKRALAEKESGKDDGPEQGRMYKNPNWWQHERMMM